MSKTENSTESIDQMRERLKALSAEVLQLSQDRDRTLEDIEFFTPQRDAIKTELKNAKALRDDLTQEIKGLQEKIPTLKQKVADQQSKLEKVGKETGDLQTNKTRLETDIIKSRGQLQTVKTELDSLQLIKVGLEREVSETKRQLQSVKNDVEGLQINKQALQKETVGITQQFNSTKINVDELDVKREKLEKEVQNLASQLDRLKQENSLGINEDWLKTAEQYQRHLSEMCTGGVDRIIVEARPLALIRALFPDVKQVSGEEIIINLSQGRGYLVHFPDLLKHLCMQPSLPWLQAPLETWKRMIDLEIFIWEFYQRERRLKRIGLALFWYVSLEKTMVEFSRISTGKGQLNLSNSENLLKACADMASVSRQMGGLYDRAYMRSIHPEPEVDVVKNMIAQVIDSELTYMKEKGLSECYIRVKDELTALTRPIAFWISQDFVQQMLRGAEKNIQSQEHQLAFVLLGSALREYLERYGKRYQ